MRCNDRTLPPARIASQPPLAALVPWPRIAALALLSLVLVVVAVVTAGCSSAPGGAGGASGGSTNTTHFAYPRGADDLVLGITVGGGLVAPGANFAQVPMTTLTGDGRCITVGPQVAIYPGPAMPNLRRQVLIGNGMQTVLNAARDAGLLVSDRSYGRPPVADAPTTTFTLVVGAGRFVSRVYALGMESGGTTPDLSNADVQHRQQLLDFERKLGDLTTWLGANVGPDEEYVVTKLAVLAQEVPADSTDPSGVTPNTLDWPLADLATAKSTSAGGVVVVEGDDLDTLRPLLTQATQITLWRSGGTTYHLIFRPILPGELGVPAVS
jgi:hypothetical protein